MLSQLKQILFIYFLGVWGSFLWAVTSFKPADFLFTRKESAHRTSKERVAVESL